METTTIINEIFTTNIHVAGATDLEFVIKNRERFCIAEMKLDADFIKGQSNELETLSKFLKLDIAYGFDAFYTSDGTQYIYRKGLRSVDGRIFCRRVDSKTYSEIEMCYYSQTLQNILMNKYAILIEQTHKHNETL